MAGGQAQASIDKTAIDWMMALHDAPNDERLRASLAAWLAADPAHRAAYDEARRVWLLTGLVPPAMGQPEAPADPPAEAPPVSCAQRGS